MDTNTSTPAIPRPQLDILVVQTLRSPSGVGMQGASSPAITGVAAEGLVEVRSSVLQPEPEPEPACYHCPPVSRLLRHLS